ncbi:MAG: nodulation protein NfeD [Candidatus Delongbacteria bacterium]|nr:nodulation protein NfeD [Candidatus Delongbacteria bacterium]
MNKIFTLFVMILSFSLFAEKIYWVNVSGMIDNGVSTYIDRSIVSAKADDADYIIFEINTFGGRVDSATKIKDSIINSPIPTIAYVNKRAISAGALIALSCKTIIMTDGSSIGAATVVDDKGEKQSEKAQSYFRSEIGSTAETNGRSKEIARAMVDEDIEIDSVITKGKLLTLTSKEAFKLSMCDTIVKNTEDLYSFLNISDPTVIKVEMTMADRIVRFLTNPIVSSLLMTLAFLGLIFEVKTAGWGVGGTVGIIALVLFFGSHYIYNLADHIEIIIFLVSIILLSLEVFVIPGFGIAGILGILGIFTSFFLTLVGSDPSGDELINAGATLSGSFILSIVGIYMMTKYLPESKFLDFIIIRNKEKRGDGVKNTKHFEELIGKSGIATTDLRLAGKIKIDDTVYQAVSKHEYINANESVTVSKVEGNKIFVIKKEN